MIKFFRRIRQKLLSEGKTGKYLKYAIGEIVLVVIGILIALQINTWNEGRKEQSRELNYLTGIKADLEVDLTRIESAIERYHRKISKLYFLDSTFILPRNFIPIKYTLDEVSVRDMINRGAGLRLTMGSYKVLTSNASAGLIKNELLLQTIQELYETRKPSLTSVYDDIKRRQDFIGQKYAVEHKYFSAKDFFVDNPDKKEVLADFDYYYTQLRLYYNSLRNMRDLIERLIDDINTELDTRT